MPAGDLNWYRHEGRSDGTANWANGGTAMQVVSGWTIYRQVLAADDSAIYGVTAAAPR
jgi:hypothetical protein